MKDREKSVWEDSQQKGPCGREGFACEAACEEDSVFFQKMKTAPEYGRGTIEKQVL
jgi:hypothetical protein